MPNSVYVYIGNYQNEDLAKADLKVVRDLYADEVESTYDAAVITRDSDGKVHIRRYEEPTKDAAWSGAAVGALVGLLFPPGIIADTLLGAAAGGIVGHLWGGMSRQDLKDLGEALDAGEASLVVISTSEFDRELAAELKAEAHQIKKLNMVDGDEFERELKKLRAS